jgi:hypothetical protein
MAPMHRSNRALKSVLIAAGAAALLAAASATGSAAATAHAAKTCKPPKYPGVGYFTSLRVTGVTCAKGNQLIVAYYKCRTKKGPAGRCTSTTVLGFRCRETRNSIPVEIDARVTCTRKHEKVVHTYQQDI